VKNPDFGAPPKSKVALFRRKPVQKQSYKWRIATKDTPLPSPSSSESSDTKIMEIPVRFKTQVRQMLRFGGISSKDTGLFTL